MNATLTIPPDAPWRSPAPGEAAFARAVADRRGDGSTVCASGAEPEPA